MNRWAQAFLMIYRAKQKKSEAKQSHFDTLILHFIVFNVNKSTLSVAQKSKYKKIIFLFN